MASGVNGDGETISVGEGFSSACPENSSYRCCPLISLD